MTVLVGILCDDGVVIGSDSAISFGVGIHLRTIERPDAVKVQIIDGKIITATTGEVGLSQRYFEKLKGMHGKNELNKAKVMEQATFISEQMIQDFRRTASVLQNQRDYGWGLGALLGLPLNGEPELFEFDPIGFHPERVGDKDNDGKCRRPRITSLGSGQLLADPFLSFSSSLFWAEDDSPKTADAKLVVAWTLQHAIKLNPGGIGGDIQLAALEKRGKNWEAGYVDLGEIDAQIKDLEEHIRDYRQGMIKKAADAEPPPKKG